MKKRVLPEKLQEIVKAVRLIAQRISKDPFAAKKEVITVSGVFDILEPFGVEERKFILTKAREVCCLSFRIAPEEAFRLNLNTKAVKRWDPGAAKSSSCLSCPGSDFCKGQS